ncbi:MAG: autotransporter-associated beta strand repeat-containing protein [Luteolibacter sp.]
MSFFDRAAPVGWRCRRLVKTGLGTLSVTGVNDYAGTTTVSQGTLLINGNSSAATSLATVQAIGTIAPGGTEELGPEIDSLAGGSVAFGGTLAFSYQMDTSSLQADLLVSSQGLSIHNLAALQLSDLMSIPVEFGTKIPLINYGGAWDGGAFAGYADDSTFTLGANTWLVNYNDTNGGDIFSPDEIYSNYFTLTEPPEPSFVRLLLLGTCWMRRRKR